MKKLLNCLLLLLVFALVFVCSEVVGLENNNLDNTYNTFGLGKNVNIAKDIYLDENSLNSARCIFDQNWFLERINDENTIINNPSTQSYVNVSSGNSINSLMVSLNNKFKFGSSAAISDIGTDKFLSFTLQNKFETNSDIEFKNYKYKFFYNYFGYYPKYFANLFKNNYVGEYENILDQTYLGYLNLLFRNAITPQVFFDIYGTHVITSGVYGGRIDYYFYSLNNQKEITAGLKSELEVGMTTSLNNIINGGTNQSFSVGAALNINNLIAVEKSKIISRGGAANSITSLDNFSSQLAIWLNSINNSQSALIDIAESGLVPLWDMLPSYYINRKQWFKNKCLEYINNNYNTFNGFAFESMEANSITQDEYTVRTEEKDIKNDDFNENHFDVVDLNYVFAKGFKMLESENYTTMDITIKMDSREKYDGYQHVYLCSSINNGTEYVSVQRKDLGNNNIIIKSTPQTYDFPNIQMANFPDGILYIKYGSSGMFENDWSNKNVKLIITYNK